MGAPAGALLFCWRGKCARDADFRWAEDATDTLNLVVLTCLRAYVLAGGDPAPTSITSAAR